MKTMFSEAQIDAITKAMIDEGKIIEAGFYGFRCAVYPNGAPQVQLDEARQSFFAGAQHLYTSILRMLDPGEEPSTADLTRLQLMDGELRAFIEDFEIRHVPTEGSA